jgi:ABC-type polysaccharide/polyol phosphate transport system ATPase subunit
MSFAIELDKVSKCYQIGRGLPSLREAVGTMFNTSPAQLHWAVKDVSFRLQGGEALGIIGPNGAGKTTILKLLSKVSYPTSGEIRVKGRMSALIELGAGFHPDLTGRENIYLNGAILGMRRDEIRKRFDQIVDFAGIGKFLDTPVKRYSSGMYARLGFAIAAHVDPEILLVDEVLAVGDYSFQQKCHARMAELRSRGTSLILVAHNLEAIRQVCDRGLVMYRGEAAFQGSAAEAVITYSDILRSAAREAQMQVPAEDGLSTRVMTFDAEIIKVTLLDAAGKPISVLRTGDKATACVDVIFHKPVHAPIFSFTVRTPDGRMVYDTTTRWQRMQTRDFAAGERAQVAFDLDMVLLDGEYELGADIAATDFGHYYDRMERALSFAVMGDETSQGIADLNARIRIGDAAPAAPGADLTSDHLLEGRNAGRA